jgi:predicted AlkP superfamily pyrophosphatase or phosphodiesterase
MPSLYSLGHNYTRALHARTVTPSITIAALTSLGTGVGPDKHGLKEPGLSILFRLNELRPLPREVRRAGLRTIVFSSDIPLSKRPLARVLTAAAGIVLIHRGKHAREVVDAARASLKGFDRGIAMVYLTDCDRAGHADGWMSDSYIQAASGIDAAIGDLSSVASDDLLIVCADHGGGGVDPRDHDTPHPTNERIPIVIAGRRVKNQHVIAREVSLLDIPATALWGLGLEVPECYGGRPLTEAFESAMATAS